MKRKIHPIPSLILALMLLTVSAHAQVVLSCKGLFKPNTLVHAGSPHYESEAWDSFKANPAYDTISKKVGSFSVSFLGKGSMGGSVFLISPNNQQIKPFVIKVYKRQESLRNDINAYAALKALTKQTDILFRLPKIEKIGHALLKMEYIPGVTILDLYYLRHQDRKISHDDYWAAKEKYWQALTKLDEAAGHFTGFEFKKVESADETARYEVSIPEYKTPTEIFIKEDNVVFNQEQNSLWIIDPF